MIKGPFVFVYVHESDKAPTYAINLAHLKAKLQGGSASAYLVTLETTLGDVEYEISFNTESIAKDFVDVVKKQASVGEAEEVRKVNYHFRLLPKLKSSQTDLTISFMNSALGTKVCCQRDPR